MKVYELLTERLQSGAYRAPGYDADDKVIVGSVKDWLDRGGVEPEHVKKAMAEIRKSELWKELQDAGLKHDPSQRKEANGTFNFRITRSYPDGKTAKGTYQVYANGQIRSTGFSQPWRDGAQTKLVSPKPRMVAGDPVASLVKTYTAALKELLAKWKKSKDNPANKKDAK